MEQLKVEDKPQMKQKSSTQEDPVIIQHGGERMDVSGHLKSLRERIFSAPDIEERVITVKEWGNAKVLVSSLTAGEGGALFAKAKKDRHGNMNSQDLAVRLVIAAAKDLETKQKIFGDADLATLSGKSLGAVQQLAQEIMEMSGMDSGALETRGD